MSEKIQYIQARHSNKTVDSEDEDHRLNVIGPNQLRPIASPLQEDWEEYFPEAAAAVQAAQAGMSPAKSPQPEQVGDALSEELPVDVG